MYVDASKSVKNGKTYVRHLLRETYRENGKIKHCNVANLSSCTDEELAAIKLALRNKKNLAELISDKEIKPEEGRRVGAVLFLNAIAEKMCISNALGEDTNGKLALWQVMARVLDRGSQLSVVHLAASHSAHNILGLRPFDKDSLSRNLKWLSKNQEEIEGQLFQFRQFKSSPQLYLYDLTSSYYTGIKDVLAPLGDKCEGEGDSSQIAIGLLADQDGYPVSLRFFDTSDVKTVTKQIDIVAKSFSIKNLILIGDWELLKTPHGELHNDEGFHYINAMTNTQVQKLYEKNLLQKIQFDNHLGEIKENSLRYIIRIDPQNDAEKLLLNEMCYVIQTNVPADKLQTNIIDNQYNYFTKAEKAFSAIKNGPLEVQHHFDVTKPSTLGQLLIMMLAYIIERELDRCWQNLNVTVAEGIDELGSIRGVILDIGTPSNEKIPQAEGIRKKLLEAANVKLPDTLSIRKVQVATTDKLQKEEMALS